MLETKSLYVSLVVLELALRTRLNLISEITCLCLAGVVITGLASLVFFREAT